MATVVAETEVELTGVQIAYNAVHAKIVNVQNVREAALFVSKLLSYQVQGCEQMTAFKRGHWDGRTSLFEMRNGRFPAGFVPVVQSRLTKKGHQVQLVRKPLPAPLGNVRPMFDEFGYNAPEYDYQPETVDLLTRHGRLIAQIATGGGKSRVAKIAVARIRRPTLFLTTRGMLMHQMREHYQDLFAGLAKYETGCEEYSKYRVGMLGDGIWDPRRLVNCGMVQTLSQRLEDPNPKWTQKKKQDHLIRRQQTVKLLEMFEMVILEEAHEASGNSYFEILNQCKNAHYRLALTATPFMKADQEDNMKLMAVSGPIGIRVTEKQLIDTGVLARPIFKVIKPEKPKGLFRTTAWPRCYEVGVVGSMPRNAAIIREAMRAKRYRLPTLILIQRENHGEALEKALCSNGLNAVFINGKDDQAVRSNALKMLSRGEYDAVVASNILDVGVDVPAIGMIIIASGGKAEVQLRQRIGRGLRRKKFGPNIAFVVEFYDMCNDTLMKHSEQRRQIIESTPGFSENVLPEGADFDFEALGFSLSQ
jgi:superfamily II DNA or RNA helicase